MVVAGSSMIALWPVFTTLHGPTSFNEEGHLLGMDSLFWGAMMEGPAGLLIALGLTGSYRLLTEGAGRTVRVGFAITMIALVPCGFFSSSSPGQPGDTRGDAAAVGAIPRRRPDRDCPGRPKLLVGLGIVQLLAFSWALALPLDVHDRIDGYRIYGAVATVLYGVGWIAFGLSLIARRRGVANLAFSWALALPLDVHDRIDGYRIYGAVATGADGVGWIAFGLSLIARRRGVANESAHSCPYPNGEQTSAT